MRAQGVAALTVGILLVILGIVISALYYGSTTTLGGGIAILVIGLAVIGVGGYLARDQRSSPVTPAQRTYSGSPERSSPGGDMMTGMVRNLAQLPEAQRREMLRTRLSSFDSMSDATRAAAMRGMMEAMRTLSPEEMARLTATRLESLAEDFDPSSRKRLMATHMEVLMGLGPEAMAGDLKATVAAMKQCHDACRMRDMASMKEVMLELPAERRAMAMQSLPPEIRSMMMS